MQKTLSKSVNPNEMAKDLPIGDVEKNKCLKLLNKLRAQDEGEVFHRPVDYKTLELFDYPSIIKKPMDFYTAEKNLKAGKYRSLSLFLEDIQQIWDNCKTYNQKGSGIYKYAVKLEKYSKNMIKELFPPSEEKNAEAELQSQSDSLANNKKKKTEANRKIPSKSVAQVAEENNQSSSDSEKDISLKDDKKNSEYISLFDKMAFSEKVRSLDNQALCQLVLYINEVDNSILDNYSEEKLHIRLDLLPRVTYEKLLKKIDDLTSLSTKTSPVREISSDSENNINAAKNKNKKQKV